MAELGLAHEADHEEEEEEEGGGEGGKHGCDRRLYQFDVGRLTSTDSTLVMLMVLFPCVLVMIKANLGLCDEVKGMTR